MENEHERNTPEAPEEVTPEPYVERPRWQVWAARIGLLVFLIFVILYYINIARGGL